MVPANPTAQPVWPSAAKLTEFSSLDVPLDCAFQVLAKAEVDMEKIAQLVNTTTRSNLTGNIRVCLSTLSIGNLSKL
jgi:hypothetical protein